MRITFLLFMSIITLHAYTIEYKSFNKVKLFKQNKLLPNNGKLDTKDLISYIGKGDIYFFFPCGSPLLIESTSDDTKETLKLDRNCKDKNPFILALQTFIEDFNDDTTYQLSASSRSDESTKHEKRYLLIAGIQDNLSIPVLDDESEYDVSVKCTNGTFFKEKRMGMQAIDINVSKLPIGHECIFDIYEEGILMGNINVMVQTTDTIVMHTKNPQASFLEAIATYSHDTNRKVVYNQNLKETFK